MFVTTVISGVCCARYAAVHAAVHTVHPIRPESHVHDDRGDAATVLTLVAASTGAG